MLVGIGPVGLRGGAIDTCGLCAKCHTHAGAGEGQGELRRNGTGPIWPRADMALSKYGHLPIYTFIHSKGTVY
eukprot:817647-Lingulodinium_polyedra.AAC.1